MNSVLVYRQLYMHTLYDTVKHKVKFQFVFYPSLKQRSITSRRIRSNMRRTIFNSSSYAIGNKHNQLRGSIDQATSQQE